MILDGKKIADEILAHAKVRAAKLDRTIKVVAIAANETSATKNFLSVKQKRAADAGCELVVHRFPEITVTELLVKAVGTSAHGADALIVQLPLAPHVDGQTVCNAIPTELDADVLSTTSRMKFEAGESHALIPPVAAAMAEILQHTGVDPKGKKAVVVGAGWLVGKPCATLLSHIGADVSHVGIDTPRDHFLAALRVADIVVSGAGSPHLIKPDMIKEGVVLFDAGTSESSGRIVGDADPSCAPKCALFTPVPGGVGPIAVALLFENAVTLAELTI